MVLWFLCNIISSGFHQQSQGPSEFLLDQRLNIFGSPCQTSGSSGRVPHRQNEFLGGLRVKFQIKKQKEVSSEVILGEFWR